MAKSSVAVRFFGDIASLKKSLNDADDELGKFGSKLADFGKKSAAVAGVAAGAAITKGFGDALDAEALNDKLAAQLGLTVEEADRFGKIASKVYGGAWGDSLETVNTALGAVGSTLRGALGPGDEQLQKITEHALDFATAFDIDVTKAVNSAGVLVRTGLAKDAQEGFDLLVAASSSVPAHLREDVLDASDEYSQFFAQLGIDGNTAFGMLVKASAQGTFELDKVGDALKELTIRSTDMSTASVDAYAAAGLSAKDMAAKFLAGGETSKAALGELVDGLLGIKDPVAQANAAIGLFGTPLEDMSTAEIPQFLEGLAASSAGFDNLAGSADTLSAQLNDNLKTKIESVKRKGLQKLAEFTAKHVIPAVERLGAWLDEKMPPILARLQANFETWGPRVAAVVQVIVRGVSALVGWLARNEDVVKALAVAVSVLLLPALVAWAASAAAAAAATLAAIAPVAAIGAAIAALAFLVIHNWDTIKAATEAVFGAIVGVVQGAINWVAQNWPLLLAILTGPIGLAVLAITRNWDTIKAGVTTVKNWIVDRFNDVIGFITGLPRRITSAASGLFDGIKDAFRSAINWVIEGWNGLEFKIPGFDPPGPGPKIGGFTLGVPDIPTLHDGGTFRAPPGRREGLALLEDGERVIAAGDAAKPGITIGQVVLGNGATVRDLADELTWLWRVAG